MIDHIYFQRKAENWVSAFVLIGCILITLFLLFAAYKAQVLGDHLSDKSANLDAYADSY